MKRRFFFSTADWIAIIFLAVAGWKFTYGIEEYIDINFNDPSFYLLNGVSLQENGLPEAEDAPLYTVWFRLLSLTQPDRIELYYRDYKLLTILVPLMLYLAFRRCSVSSITALVVSAFSLISYFNFPSFTRVSHFAVCVVLASLICASFARRFLTATVIATLGALLASYVRPELFLAWILFALMALLVIIYGFRKEFRGRDLISFALFVLVNVAVLFFAGIPIGGERSGVAFAEHFALNWVNWTGSSLDPWMNAQKIYSESFGNAAGVVAALWANPGMFVKHVATNLSALLPNVRYLFSLHTRPLITGSLGLGILVCLLLVFGLGKNLYGRGNIKNNRRMLLFSLFYLFTMLVAVTVIHPRLHYLVLVCVLLVMIVAMIFLARENGEKEWDEGRIVLAGLVIVGLIPVQDFTVIRENVETVRLIRSLGINSEVHVFHEGGVPQVYLGDNYRSCPLGWKSESFDRFLHDQKINMVIVTDKLRSDPRLARDDEWSQFLDRYTKRNFVKFNVQGTSRAILVQKDLIGNGNSKRL